MLANALTWLQHISQNKFWSNNDWIFSDISQICHLNILYNGGSRALGSPRSSAWRLLESEEPEQLSLGRSVSRSWLLLASGRYCACADPGKPCSAQSTHAQTALYRHILLEVRMHFIDDENIFFVSPSTHGRKKCLCKIFLLSYIHMTSN